MTQTDPISRFLLLLHLYYLPYSVTYKALLLLLILRFRHIFLLATKHIFGYSKVADNSTLTETLPETCNIDNFATIVEQ